jgi:hypothetical protein
MEPNDIDGYETWNRAWLTIGDYRMRGAQEFTVRLRFDESARPKLVACDIETMVPGPDDRKPSTAVTDRIEPPSA